MPGALDGVRILDVTTVLLGPYGTQLLADMGADVIKVEAPPTGDIARNMGTVNTPGMGGIFLRTYLFFLQKFFHKCGILKNLKNLLNLLLDSIRYGSRLLKKQRMVKMIRSLIKS